MSTSQWNTPASLRGLLNELVSWESRTTTDGECTFSTRVAEKLKTLSYFTHHPEHLKLHDAGLGRNSVLALYKNPAATDTVVLISHFDTVWTEEYGALEPLAYHPEKLTAALHQLTDELPEDARKDLLSGDYLFGRGTMDMKMGLALHMSLIEKASLENWPINLVLLTVPDEEVNSAGMRTAVEELVRMRDVYGLSYKLFLNSEPTFSQEPGDPKEYVYSGTIGKIMPAALFYGKETHVGEPLKGLTATYISSFLAQSMEFNSLFKETNYGETTPLPVSLQLKDLKTSYSTQTPYRAASLYNVFLMDRDASEIMELFADVAVQAMSACNTAYQKICEQERTEPVGEVRVIRYEELLEHAQSKLGSEAVELIIENAVQDQKLDDRDKCFKITDALLIECQELTPATVLLFAPPYYPAVNTSEDPLVIKSIDLMKRTAMELGTHVDQVHYFNGICDLSYVHYTGTATGWTAYEHNTPVWGKTYSIPFEAMTALDAPVLNVGPFGKDAHQRTERLHIESAFVRLPVMLEVLVKSLCSVEEIEHAIS
ncbi:M20/M25/M40 family metallo-hydrolase [Sporosarcina sp. BI001-red]|uniref:M20/M25/M40 family metallo-hydrolase n=1 Tax=Sporosarcina sp. BI001-red TaxID=2282866 RepID=UPI000E221200|nr:M20/M25/M40 family metallo-hydrolase [Sporosarcina sp. BI001-red]REB08620.1 M20/M25/M40 family metallo-hydrolase [Sporosarcina sp. BI001-red]